MSTLGLDDENTALQTDLRILEAQGREQEQMFV